MIKKSITISLVAISIIAAISICTHYGLHHKRACVSKNSESDTQGSLLIICGTQTPVSKWINGNVE